MLVYQKTSRQTELLPSLAKIRQHIGWELGREDDNRSFEIFEEYAYFRLGRTGVAPGSALEWT